MNNTLPPAFVAWLRSYAMATRHVTPRNIQRGIIIRWTLWLDGETRNALPGYATPPPAGPSGFPAGWSLGNIAAIVREARGIPSTRSPRSHDMTRYAHA